MTAMEGVPNHPKAFGEELQRLRQSAGLSLEDIADETKISRQILRWPKPSRLRGNVFYSLQAHT
jgi:hypothetical protein